VNGAQLALAAEVAHGPASGTSLALVATRRRVLVLDPDVNSRAVLRDELTSSGIEVVQAADEADALTAVAQSEPDAVVLDWFFPGGGLALVRKLAAHGMADRIVLLSPLSDPRDQRSALEAGVARFLVKPTRPEQLIEALDDVALAQSSGH
jgi:CheY-like chemotaxis protein